MQEQLKSVEAYRESVRLAGIRYDSGLSNYLEIIDAQIQMYPAEQSPQSITISAAKWPWSICIEPGWRMESERCAVD